MLAPSKVIKATAKTALSGNYLKSAAVGCVLIFAFFINSITVSLISVVGGNAAAIAFSVLFNLFVFSPLFIGVICYFRRMLWGCDDSVLIIFKYFSNRGEYIRVLRLSLILMLKMFMAAIVLYFPSIIVWVLSSGWFYSVFELPVPTWTSSLWTLNSILTALASIALFFVMLKYYMSAFLFVGDDNMHPAEAVNMSTVIAKHTGAEFFSLIWSFALWILLSLFVAPLIFVLPYFLASYCVHCRFAVTAYNREADLYSKKDAPRYKVDETEQ